MADTGTIQCPLECVNVACDEPDWVQRNGSWLTALIMGVVGMVLTYFLKSRCYKIGCCGNYCERDVLKGTPDNSKVGV